MVEFEKLFTDGVKSQVRWGVRVIEGV